MSLRERLSELRARVPQIDAAEAAALQARGAQVLDVREPHEIAQGSPAGALRLGRGFLELQVEQLVPDRAGPLLVICASGTRSLFAAESLLGLGYADVRSVSDGFEGWRRRGLPIEVPPAPLDPRALDRYSRHLRLPEVGEAGQARLQQSRVLLVGLGGLGSPAALYLAAAGVGTLILVDDDVVERTNLQRQIIHADQRVGDAKTASARHSLLALNPDIEVRCHAVRLGLENVDTLIGGLEAQRPQVVIDGADNFATRYLVNDACLKWGLPNVHGSVYRFEGQLSVFCAATGGRRGPCYRCLYPRPPPPELAPSCAEAGVLGVLPGVIGLLQATETLKILLGIGEPMIGRLLHYDALGQRFADIEVAPDPACRWCARPFPGYQESYQAVCASGA